MAIDRLVGSDALTTCSFGTPVTTGRKATGARYIRLWLKWQ